MRILSVNRTNSRPFYLIFPNFKFSYEKEISGSEYITKLTMPSQYLKEPTPEKITWVLSLTTFQNVEIATRSQQYDELVYYYDLIITNIPDSRSMFSDGCLIIELGNHLFNLKPVDIWINLFLDCLEGKYIDFAIKFKNHYFPGPGSLSSKFEKNINAILERRKNVVLIKLNNGRLIISS